MNIEEFVILPIAVGVCIVTQAVKQLFTTAAQRDKFTPIIALTLGVLFNTWYNQWQFDYVIFLNGLASGLAGIGAFSTVKSVFKEEIAGIAYKKR